MAAGTVLVEKLHLSIDMLVHRIVIKWDKDVNELLLTEGVRRF